MAIVGRAKTHVRVQMAIVGWAFRPPAITRLEKSTRSLFLQFKNMVIRLSLLVTNLIYHTGLVDLLDCQWCSLPLSLASHLMQH